MMVQQRRKLFLSLVRGATLVAWCRDSLLCLEHWSCVSARLWGSFRSSALSWPAAPRGGEDWPALSATLTVDSSHLLWPSSQNCPPSVHQRVRDAGNYCGHKSFQIMINHPPAHFILVYFSFCLFSLWFPHFFLLHYMLTKKTFFFGSSSNILTYLKMKCVMLVPQKLDWYHTW